MNKNFLFWLIGFLDAEGNFQVFPKAQKNKQGIITRYGIGVGFHLGLHIRDLAILENIKIELGNLGKIYEYNEKNEAHYAITKKEELREFISKVFKDHTIITDYQYNRFMVMKSILDKDLKSTKTIEEFKKEWPGPEQEIRI